MQQVGASSEQYIQAVLRSIHAPAADEQRIAAELRSHFQSAQEAGESLHSIETRLGSPVEVAEAYMAQIPLIYAGFLLRLAAFVIDMCIIVAIGSLLSFFVIFCTNLVPDHPIGIEILLGAVLIGLAVSGSLVILGLVLLYFPVLEGRFGKTPGKHLFGLWVLKENGLPVGYKEAFIRRLTFYFEMLPVDSLFIPFTGKKQRGFDIVARTVVVRS